MGAQGKALGFGYAREFSNILGTDACAIYLHLPKPNRLLLIDAEGYPDGATFLHTYEPSYGPVARVWEQKKFLSLIWDSDGRTDISMYEAGYRSFLGVPIQRTDSPTVNGVLVFQTVDKWIFPTGQIIQARKFGEVVAAALSPEVVSAVEAAYVTAGGQNGDALRGAFGKALDRAPAA